MLVRSFFVMIGAVAVISRCIGFAMFRPMRQFVGFVALAGAEENYRRDGGNDDKSAEKVAHRRHSRHRL